MLSLQAVQGYEGIAYVVIVSALAYVEVVSLSDVDGANRGLVVHGSSP